MNDLSHSPDAVAVKAGEVREALARGDCARLAAGLGGQWPSALATALAKARGSSRDVAGAAVEARAILSESGRLGERAWVEFGAGRGDFAEAVEKTRFAAADRLGMATGTSLRMAASKGERSRFIIPDLADGASFEFHALISIENIHGVTPVLALRLLHGPDPEEIVLTFRANRLLVGGMVERELDWSAGARLLSVAVSGETLRVDVDGVAVWYAPRRRSDVATGINLDLIGVAGGEVAVDVHWFRLGPVARSMLDGHLEAAGHIFADSLRAAGPDLALDLEAYRLLPTPGRALVAGAMTRAVAQATAYPEHILGQLGARLDGGGAEAAGEAPEPIVRIEDVAVEMPTDASAKSLIGLLRGKQKAMLSILKGVSFSAYSGDIIGIIGKNGAGKSTLLRSIIGSIPISRGSIVIRGKPVLLRPGAGMQQELTGRENILLAGLYMGLTPREVDEIVDDVIEFSEIGEHIDRPYQYYSDGMRARLIFSLATSISPELLMLDELLGAGDIGFQEKAARRLDTFIRNAKVVFVVQHGTDFVMTRCTKCLYIKDGRQAYFGDPRIAVEMYQSDI
ncbi:MAG TPA: ATP-binding cassette domain-containing protein [Hyphomicrobiaceae bacterium]|nr:ATP-binding cassette domain-containing protein [Hyphomicrobiaceae bacterium]